MGVNHYKLSDESRGYERLFLQRVILFRKTIAREKDVLGLTESACASPQSTLITVHRSRIIEDGYRQLALLPPNALKGLIRVKFINEQVIINFFY